jgi:hypothetical protein
VNEKEAELNKTAWLGWSGILAVVLFSGATCDRYRRAVDPLAPAAFLGPPTLDDIVFAVNANTHRVQNLQTDNASLRAPGVPSLRASLAMEAPRRFRLRATLLGPELDVGSNDELFWMWARSNPDPVVYYARHDEFRGTSVQQLMPIEPTWLLEAFGLVRLDPAAAYEGPVTRGEGQVEIRSRAGAANQLIRTLVIDETYGWVVEQHVTDARGQRLASARATNHRFYPQVGASLPHHIEIDLPPAQISFVVDVGQFAVNQLSGDPLLLWSFPHIEGSQPINLADAPQTTPAWPTPAPASRGEAFYERSQASSFRPRYRGYAPVR